MLKKSEINLSDYAQPQLVSHPFLFFLDLKKNFFSKKLIAEIKMIYAPISCIN